MSRADTFTPLDATAAQRWAGFGQSELHFPRLVGLSVEDVRRDYCRMRMRWRPEITQPAGVAHGGALATLIDSVVVPAIGAAYDEPRQFVTVDMHVQYKAALVGEDAVAEGWVTQRGRSIVFCEVEVIGAASGRAIAKGLLTYKVSSARNEGGTKP